MRVRWSEGFVPNRDRGEFDEAEFVRTLEYFGNPVLPERYVEFLRTHYETRSRMPIGYEARGAPDVLSPGDMRWVSEGHFWGREFMPFMATSHAFIAFDLRAASDDVPPIVFLDWDLEDDFEVHYDRVERLADDLDGFLSLLGLWWTPDRPRFTACTDLEPFRTLGVARDQVAFRPFVGLILRSGLFGSERVRVGRQMGCISECLEEPALVEELTVRRVWERIRPVVGDRLVPFMTGEDGWLALDYREVDQDPPVVFIPRDGDRPIGEPQHVADSVIDAYDMFT